MPKYALRALAVSAGIAATMLSTAFAQDSPKKQLRPFVEPPVRVASIKSGLVLKDDGCARDYVRALGLEGVEKQRLLLDIMKLGCGNDHIKGITVRVLAQVEIQVGETKIMFRRIAWPPTGSLMPLGLIPESDLLMEGADPKKP